MGWKKRIKTYRDTFRLALQNVFAVPVYRVVFAVFSLLMFLFLVAVPILATPGNTVVLLWNETPWWGVVILVFLALGMGLLGAMQVYVFRLKRTFALKEGTGGIVAFFSSVVTGLFSVSSCASCLGTLFTFIGFGTMVRLIAYRWYITLGGFLMVLLSLGLTAQTISGKCNTCIIEKKRNKR